MKAPSCFGYPLWVGLTSRIGKKHLRRQNDFRYRVLHEMQGFKIGDLVRTCTGLNSRLIAVTPCYSRVGKGKAVYDFDLETTSGGCSFFHCGVEPPCSYEEAQATRAQFLASMIAKGEEAWCLHFREDVMTIHPDGTFTIDREKLEVLRADYPQHRDATRRYVPQPGH